MPGAQEKPRSGFAAGISGLMDFLCPKPFAAKPQHALPKIKGKAAKAKPNCTSNTKHEKNFLSEYIHSIAQERGSVNKIMKRSRKTMFG
jgi:hypothetical protein